MYCESTGTKFSIQDLDLSDLHHLQDALVELKQHRYFDPEKFAHERRRITQIYLSINQAIFSPEIFHVDGDSVILSQCKNENL